MLAKRNLRLITPYLVFTLEGVCHGVYLLWLTVHKGISPFAAAAAIAVGDLALLLLEVPTGVFADRIGAKRSLILGSLCQVLGLALFWKVGSIPALVLAVLAIAIGDAFRHGADEALVYRSCAAIGEAESFGRRMAAAHAWALAALVGLTALGGFIVDRFGFDAAWALEVGLSVVGLGIAFAMTDLPPIADEPEDEDEAGASPLAGLGARLPWAIIVPASMIGTLSSIGELIAQTTPREGMSAGLVALVIAGGIALEALGSFLVARGWVPITQRMLDMLGIGAIAGLVAVALAPVALLPALLFIFLASGTAPAIRSALVQRQAREGERATAASACSALDMIGKTAGLPLGAWLSGHTRLAETALILGLTAILTWVPARGRLAS